MTAFTNETVTFVQTDAKGSPLCAGDRVEICFSADGEDISFNTYVDCGGLSCQEIPTIDGRYLYIYGEKAVKPAMRAALWGEGPVYRHSFETAKGIVKILLEFDAFSEGQAFTLTHIIPGKDVFRRAFQREEAVLEQIQKIAA